MLIIARRTRSKLSDVRDIIIRQKERMHSNFSILIKDNSASFYIHRRMKQTICEVTYL